MPHFPTLIARISARISQITELPITTMAKSRALGIPELLTENYTLGRSAEQWKRTDFRKRPEFKICLSLSNFELVYYLVCTSAFMSEMERSTSSIGFRK